MSEEIKTVSVSAIEYDAIGSKADTKIVLYKCKSRSLHEPIPPNVARDEALEAYDEIIDTLK